MTQLGRVVKDDGCKGEYAVAEMSVNRMPSKYRFWMYQNSHFPVDGSWKERFSWSDTSFSSSANSPPHRSWHLVKYQTSQWNKKDSNQHWKVTHSLMWLFLQKSMPHSVNKGRRVVSVNHTLSSLALHTRDLWTICCFLSGAVRGPDRFLSYSFALARSQGSVKTFSSWGWPGNVRLSASQAYCVHNQCCSAFWMLETQSTCVFLVQKRKKNPWQIELNLAAALPHGQHQLSQGTEAERGCRVIIEPYNRRGPLAVPLKTSLRLRRACSRLKDWAPFRVQQLRSWRSSDCNCRSPVPSFLFHYFTRFSSSKFTVALQDSSLMLWELCVLHMVGF